MNYPNNPHDKFFKTTMSDMEIASDFIRNYFPSSLTEQMDFSTLSIQKDSYVDEDFTEYFSDILYRIQMRGKESYVYLLFEHKSYPYPDISLQLLGYIVNIYRHLRSKDKKKLPPVIPFVFYHGQEAWNIGMNFSECIEGYEALSQETRQYIPDFRYLLCDMSRYSEDELVGSIPLQIALRTLKYISARDDKFFFGQVMQIVRLIEDLPNSQQREYRFEQVIRYVFYARKDLDLEKMKQELKGISKERSEQLMSIAEKLMKKGWEEGREEGREESMIQIAKNMLEMGSEIPFIVRATGLSEERIKVLQKEMEI